MARLEQYSFDDSPFPGNRYESNWLFFEDKSGQGMFDYIDIEYSSVHDKSAQLWGRAVLSMADAAIRMSTVGNDGRMTLTYPDDEHRQA